MGQTTFTNTGPIRLFLDRGVAGLDNAMGKFFHATGPGPDGEERPIPLFVQLLDPQQLSLVFRPGDPVYQVLSNDQNRFKLPRALPPLLSVLLAGDDDNPTPSNAIVRHAYSEGAFVLFHDLVERGYKFTFREFLKLFCSLSEVLAFLHSHGIVHGQWNPRSILCIPQGTPPPGESETYRYDLLNTGLRFLDPLSIPREFLERGYFAPEVLSSSTHLPDPEAFSLEADIYMFAAFLKDVFQRACSVEDLTHQATRIRDVVYREAVRRGEEPHPERIRNKEQEILDHLYTIKVKAEDLIKSSLRDRRDRSSASQLWGASRSIYQKTLDYDEALGRIGFDPVNVFGGELQHYVPYQIRLEPPRVNNAEETTVAITGHSLPCEVVRVTLGDSDEALGVVETSPGKIRFLVPSGTAPGSHQVLINNRRTSSSLEVIAPAWGALVPASVRKPWPGFGNITVRVVGKDLPSQPRFTLLPPEGESIAPPEPAQPQAAEGANGAEASAAVEPSPAGPLEPLLAEREAVADRSPSEDRAQAPEEAAGDRGTRTPEGPSGDDATAAHPECWRLELPPEAEVGTYRLLSGGIDTGLALTIEEALPEPVLTRLQPCSRVLNHREQRLVLEGRSFHSSMAVDLGDGAPQARLEVEGDRLAALVLPAGFPAGEYTLRLNRQPAGLSLTVVQPAWTAVEPRAVLLGGKPGGPRTLLLRGQNLPAPHEESGEVYRLVTARGKEITAGVLASEEVEAGALHRVRLSGSIPRGRPRLSFGGRDTRLQVRVKRTLPRAAKVAAAAVLLGAAGLAAYAGWDAARARIDGIDPPRAYNFGDSRVVLSGKGIERVLLTDDAGKELMGLQVEEGSAGADGRKSFVLRPAGIPAGKYHLVPRGRWGTGRTAKDVLQVMSPGFEVQPAAVNRLSSTPLSLTAAPGFALKSGTVALARHRGGEEASGKPASPAAEVERASLPLDGEGRFTLTAATFGPGDEGEYTLSLDGAPLGGEFTATGKPLALQVVGPRAVALEKSPITIMPEGSIRVGLKGEDLPAGVPLALMEEGKKDAALRLRAAGGGYEGPARAGKFLLAWDTPRGPEAIPGLALEVYPSPLVTGVSPTRIQPDVPTELTIEGLNLVEVGEVLLSPTAGTPGEREGTIHLTVDRARLIQEGPRARYKTEPLSLKTGRYSILPGGKAALEVVEDCAKLLDAYRKDAADREKLTACLKESTAAPDVRRAAADLFFDQGLFAEAMDLFQSLTDLKSRFRAAFIARYLELPHASGFQRREDDPRADPYWAWAAALGWVGKEAGKDVKIPPEDPGAPWEIDFLRGTLTEDPQGAIGSFTAAIEKKRAAAGTHEAGPFLPAVRGLSGAQLRLALGLFKAGRGAEARDTLQKTFFEKPERYADLAEEDRAKASFFFGHALLWYSGDEENAVKYFKHAVETAPATEYGTYSALYLDALGSAAQEGSSAPVLAAREGSWESSFLAALKGCRMVRRAPNYNVLTESYDFGSLLYPEERKASLELHRAVKALESLEEVPDPLSEHALLFYLRNAQSVSWPAQEGGQKAKDHRDKLMGLKLEGESGMLRDFFILEAELEPLESAQLTLLPPAEVQKQARKVLNLERGGLAAGVKERLKRLQKKLQT